MKKGVVWAFSLPVSLMSSACLFTAAPDTIANLECKVEKIPVTSSESSPSPLQVGRGLTLQDAIDNAYEGCYQHGANCDTMKLHSHPVRVVFSRSVVNGVIRSTEESERLGPLAVTTYNHEADDEEMEVTISFDVSSQ
jgi:hypothetical protein